MNLFNRKTLERQVSPAPIPPNHLAKLAAWSELITSKRILAMKEVSLHGQFTAQIVEGVLGYRGSAQGAAYTVEAEKAVLNGSVDLALGRFGGRGRRSSRPSSSKGPIRETSTPSCRAAPRARCSRRGSTRRTRAA